MVPTGVASVAEATEAQKVAALERLTRALTLRRDLTDRPDADAARALRLIKRSVYAIWSDCCDLGVKVEADLLVDRFAETPVTA